MAELNREHLIEIRIGTGDPQSMRVKPGQPIGPTQIGTESDWRLDAPGVAPEHAELYFDGSQLFVRSVSPGAPVLVAGRPVPGVWTPLEPLSEIMLGGARLWFGPDVAGAPAGRVAREELLEDDDNVETSVADTSARPWGDVSALVQRGMDASRSQAAALGPPGADPARSQAGALGPPPGADPARSQAGALGRLPPPEPPPPRPAPSFWPTSPPIQSAPPAPPAPPPPDAGAIGGPSKTSRSDDSGMTRIEPVEDVQRRRELSTSGAHYPRPDLSMSGSNYPRANLSTSGSNYPRADLSTSGSNYPRANLSTSGSNYPRMAPPGAPAFGAPPPPSFGPPPPSSDGRATLSEPPGYGGTEVLQGSPMPPLRSAPPGAMPSFGAPPGVPSFGAPPPSSSGMPPPLDGGFARQTGMHPQVAAMPGGMPGGMPGPRFDQPITPHTTEGLARADTGAKKGAWAELSGPKKALVFLSPLIVGSVLVLFMGEELGIDPKPGRPQARPSSAATSAAAARPTGAPTTTAAATAPPSAAPSAVAAAPDSTITPPDDSDMGAPPTTAAPTAPRAAPPPPEPATRTPPGSKSLQRRAADAVAAGAYAQAAELYEQLAKENPNKPAYAEAAAILRAKAAQR